MRLTGLLSTLSVLVVVATAAVSSTSKGSSLLSRQETCATELPCDIALAVAAEALQTPSQTVDTNTLESRSLEDAFTNGQRLALGLPLKAPRDFQQNRSPTRRQAPSASPSVSYRGYIKVIRADGNGELGYLSRHPFSGAQHRYQDNNNAMVVNFRVPAGSSSASQIEINTENSDIQSTFPRLSLVEGRDNTNSDISSGSFQYGYFAGSDSTPSGAKPQSVDNSYSAATGTPRDAESAVWSWDAATNAITVQWINTDGSSPTTQIFGQSTALYIGGDPGAFVSRYPSPIISIKLVFVPL